jgi:hypothetical protein
MRRASVLPIAAIAALALGGTADAGSTAGKVRAKCVETKSPHGSYQLTTNTGKGPVWILDTGTWKFLGPVPAGTRIKYTQAPGTQVPHANKLGDGGPVAYHIVGKGPLSVLSTDRVIVRC